MITIAKLSYFCVDELCGGVLSDCGRMKGGTVFQCRKCDAMFWADAVVPFDRDLKASVAAASEQAAVTGDTDEKQSESSAA